MHQALSPPSTSRSETIDLGLAVYRQPWWLKTPYGASALLADFGDAGRVEVSFELRMSDGRPLQSNPVLVGEIYDFLCLQSLPSPGRPAKSNRTEKEHFCRSLVVLDYFLLNDKSGAVARHGLSSLGSQALEQFLLHVASHRITAESIYGWSKRLSEYLLRQAATLPDAEFRKAVAEYKALLNIGVPEPDWRLRCSLDELLRIRAFLRREGLYGGGDTRKRDFGLMPRTAELRRRIYGNNTFAGATYEFPSAGTTFPELCLRPVTRYQRELPAVSVRANPRMDTRCSVLKFNEWRAKLLDLGRLSAFGVGISADVIRRVERKDLESILDLRELDGFRPVPAVAVAHAMKNGIELFYKHGDHLLTSLSNVVVTCQRLGCTPLELEYQGSLSRLLTRDTVALGIRSWSLSPHFKSLNGDWPNATTYLSVLRSQGCGLLDMCRVLLGGSLVVVGGMQAARQGEVLALRKSDLHESDAWLRTLTRKSGFESLRYQDFRPAAPVVMHILRRLATCVESLQQTGAVLFSLPNEHGRVRPLNADSGNACIDVFIDYIEGLCDGEGRRYYLRQHQLRLFFATAFFYAFGFAGVDTLRWFLRHLNAQQVWAYIEDTTPGGVLRRQKAAAVTSMIREGDAETYELLACIRRRYNVRSVDVMTDGELLELIEDLQSDGSVEIEPVFAKDGTGDLVKLGILVWE